MLHLCNSDSITSLNIRDFYFANKIPLCIYVGGQTCVSVYTVHVSPYVCMYICMYMYVCVCLDVYICMYEGRQAYVCTYVCHRYECVSLPIKTRWLTCVWNVKLTR